MLSLITMASTRTVTLLNGRVDGDHQTHGSLKRWGNQGIGESRPSRG